MEFLNWVALTKLVPEVSTIWVIEHSFYDGEGHGDSHPVGFLISKDKPILPEATKFNDLPDSTDEYSACRLIDYMKLE